jgi:hypothetical protein
LPYCALGSEGPTANRRTHYSSGAWTGRGGLWELWEGLAGRAVGAAGRARTIAAILLGVKTACASIVWSTGGTVAVLSTWH